MKLDRFAGRILALSLAALMPLSVIYAAPAPAKSGAAEKPAPKTEPVLEASLTVEPADLSPESTIEVVFPTPMIAKDKIGSKEGEPPLIAVPPLAGTFEWVSTRSGHYHLTEVPRFNASYDFKLRPGLQDLAGKKLSPETLASVSSADFRIIDQNPKWFSGDDIQRQPSLLFQFNDNVTPENAAMAMAFVSETPPLTVPAVVRFAKGSDFQSMYAELQQTWAEQITGIKPDLTKDAVRMSALVVEPKEPLPVAAKWRVRIAQTLGNASGHDHLAEGTEVHLGDVEPFKVEAVRAHTPFDRPYFLEVVFNKSTLPHKDEDWSKAELDDMAMKLATAVHIDPPVPDLKPDVLRRYLSLHGGFQPNKTYRITIDPSLVSGDGLALEAQTVTDVTFVPNPPYIAAPAFMRGQLAAGAGEYAFTVANVDQVRVRVKRLTGSELLLATDKYREYSSKYHIEESKRKDYKPLPIDSYPGTPVYEQTISVNKPLDQSELIKLNWRQILGADSAGAVFVELEGRGVKELPQKAVVTQSLIQFTDLGLMQKSNGRETMVFVSSLKSGLPVAGARLTLVDKDQRLIGFADSDASGIATLKGGDPAMVLVEKDGDATVIRCEDGRYDSFVPYDIPQAWRSVWKAKRQTFVFSDRELYRPGDTVHVKGMTRLRVGDDLQLDPEQAKGTFTLRDARYRVVMEKPFTFTANGSWTEDLKLPEGPLGWYNLELRFAHEKADGDDDSNEAGAYSFRVDDYRPNTFEVKLDPAKVEFLPDRMKMPISAKYYMGKALSQAKVSWHANSLRQFAAPEGFEDYHFGEAPRWAHYGQDRDADGNYEDGKEEEEGEWWVSGTTNVNDDGTATLEMPLPPADRASLPLQVTVGADVTDINQQTITGTAEFEVPGATFLLGVRGPRFFGTAGQPMHIEVAAVTSTGKPGPANAEAQIKIERQEYHTLKIATAGGGSTTKEQVILRNELEQAVRLAAPAANSAPTATVDFTPSHGGTYFVTAEAVDPQGKKILSRLPLYVIGGGEFPWAMEDGARINLQPEKKMLKPGEEAVIVVKTPIAGKALVTVERNHIHSHFITDVSPDQPVIRVPVQDNEAPNVFVSVIVVRGSDASPKKDKVPEYRVGYCELTVDSKRDELQIAVGPATEEVRPGEPVTVSAVVTDFKKKPVPGAEVTLFAVDEGVLSLMNTKTPSPSGVFHAPMPLAIDNFTSFDDLLPEDAAARERGNKGFVIGGGGDENEAPLQVRKNFVATPLWLATAMTDAAGRISSTFTAPDNLTRYRVMAVASEGATRFGNGESAFKINKPLMIEPVVPRFARLGDEVLLKAVIHNTTQNSGKVEVTLELDSTATFISEPRFFVPVSLKPKATDTPKIRRQIIDLAAGGTTSVAFPVKFEKLGIARWRWVAKTTDWTKGTPALTDATESVFEVNHPQPELREVHYARIDGAAPPDSLSSKMNPALLEGEGALTIAVSTSRLYETRDALDYVLHYPYGCAEQTSSATLPWIALGGYQALFPNLLEAGKSKEAIQHGVNRLLQMVTEDGGLAYWPGGAEPSLWASGYGGLTLLRARDAGAAVPDEVVDKLLAYLSKSLRGLDDEKDNYNITDSALALYALAKGKRAEPAYQNVLYARRESLPEAARLYTALAMCLSQTPEQQIKGMLGWKPAAPPVKTGEAKKPKIIKGKAKPLVPTPAWSHWAGNAPNRALRLIAYTHLGLTEDAEKLAVETLQARNELGEWGNTYANAWTLTALAAYERSLKNGGDPLMATVLWDAISQPLTIEKSPGSASATFPLTDKLASAPLRVDLPKDRQAFTRIEASAYPPNREFGGENKGYSIARRYEKMLPDGHTAAAENLRVGDMIVVNLDIKIGGGDRYLAISDPLPAVLEAINPEFETQNSDLGEGMEPWFCDHREIRADRALFFTDYAPQKGSYAIQYLARVIAEGDTIAPSARIEAMYEPQKYGLSASDHLKTLPAAAGDVAGN